MRRVMVIGLAAMLVSVLGCAAGKVYVVKVGPRKAAQFTDEAQRQKDLLGSLPAVHKAGRGTLVSAKGAWVISYDEADKADVERTLGASPRWQVLDVRQIPQRELGEFLESQLSSQN